MALKVLGEDELAKGERGVRGAPKELKNVGFGRMMGKVLESSHSGQSLTAQHPAPKFSCYLREIDAKKQ